MGLDENRTLSTPEKDLVAFFVDKYSPRVPRIDENKIVVAKHGDEFEHFKEPSYPNQTFARKVGFFVLAIPYDGDPDLFRVTPAHQTLNRPRAHVLSNELQFKLILRGGKTREVLKARQGEVIEQIYLVFR